MILLALDAPDPVAEPDERAQVRFDDGRAYYLLRLGGVFLFNSRYADAERVFRFAASEFERIERPVEPILARGGLGVALVRLGRVADGRAALADSHEALRRLAPVNRRHKFVLEEIVEIYKRFDPDRAAEYHGLLSAH